MESISRRQGDSKCDKKSLFSSPACPPVEDRDLVGAVKSRADDDRGRTVRQSARTARTGPTGPEADGPQRDRVPGERGGESAGILSAGPTSLVSVADGSLGIYRDSPSTPAPSPFSSPEFDVLSPHPIRVYSDDEKASYARQKRAENYRRLQTARRWIEEARRDRPDIFTPSTLLGCGAAPHQGSSAIEIDGEGRIHHAHRRCKSWTCPQCAYANALARADHIERALTAAFALGWRVLFITYTLPHTSADSAVDTMTALNKAYSAFHDWRSFRSFKESYGLEGVIKALDFTFTENGCHAHLHCLYFFSYSADPLDIYQGARLLLPSLWDTAVFKRTGKHISSRYGINIEPVAIPDGSSSASAIAEYVSKVVSIYASKPDPDKDRVSSDSLSPFQLLDDPNNERNKALYLDWVRAHYGKRRLRFSPGLEARLGLPPSDYDMPDTVVLGGLSNEACLFLRDPSHIEDFRRRLLANPLAAASWLDASTVPSNWHEEVLWSLSGVSFDDLPSWVDFHTIRPSDIVLDAPQGACALSLA